MTATPPQPSSDTRWFIYIVECSDTTYYTGVTTDLKRRLQEHNSTTKGAKYTRHRRPVTLVYYEETDSRQKACKREYAIKQMRITKKKILITQSSGLPASGQSGSNLP